MAKIKKEKQPTALDLYEICLSLGSMYDVNPETYGWAPYSGLCGLLGDTKYFKTLERLRPTAEDCAVLTREGMPIGHWGFGQRSSTMYNNRYKFTPLRQTILLLIAAMHDEL